jgi:hypothetical protein
MERNTQEEIYGGGIAGGASQPPMLIALHGKVTKLDPSWHVRHFGWWMGNKYPDDILRMPVCLLGFSLRGRCCRK